MRTVSLVLMVFCGLLSVAGVVWILQGIDILPGSVMTGDIRWAYRGAAVLVAGVFGLTGAVRLRRRSNQTDSG